MKGAIGSVEIFGLRKEGRPRRFTLTVAAPSRCPRGDGWDCRVVLADVHPAESVHGEHSVEALAKALHLGREWVSELRRDGYALYQDQPHEKPFEDF